MQAALSNQYESVDLLLKSGAIPDMQDDVGQYFTVTHVIGIMFLDGLVCTNGSSVYTLH